MKKTLLYPILLVTAIAFAGCMKMDCDCDHDHGHDTHNTRVAPVWFQYEYYNYAWGFRHNGFLIDNQGVIRGFSQPDKWIAPDSTGLMSEADLRYNLAQCDTICGRANKEELDLYYRKIKEIRSGEIADYGLVMADAGTGAFSAWYWNEKEEKFENVFLISNGDYSRVNTHPDVKEMVAWLKWLGEKTNRFWWYGK